MKKTTKTPNAAQHPGTPRLVDQLADLAHRADALIDVHACLLVVHLASSYPADLTILVRNWLRDRAPEILAHRPTGITSLACEDVLSLMLAGS